MCFDINQEGGEEDDSEPQDMRSTQDLDLKVVGHRFFENQVGKVAVVGAKCVLL